MQIGAQSDVSGLISTIEKPQEFSRSSIIMKPRLDDCDSVSSFDSENPLDFDYVPGTDLDDTDSDVDGAEKSLSSKNSLVDLK